MGDILELVGSLSVLMASIAGLLAINKWRVEKLDKSKIDAFENYEICVDKVKEKLRGVYLEHVFDEVIIDSNDKDERVFKEEDVFIVYKKTKVKELKESLDECRTCVEKFSTYSSQDLFYHFNYYYYFYMCLDEALWTLTNELSEIDGEYSNLYSLVADNVDKRRLFSMYTLGQSMFMLDASPKMKAINVIKKAGFKDLRGRFDYYFDRLLKLEKMIIYSGFLMRIFLKLKIFILKCRLAGKVWFLGDENVWFIMDNGGINVIPKKEDNILKIEKREKATIIWIMIRKAALELFS